MESTLLGSLRRSTATEHQAIERTLRVARRGVTLADYREYLSDMWGVHRSFEPRILARPEVRTALPDVCERARLQLIEHDLASIGMEPAAIARLPVAPDWKPETTEEVLGMMYVMEGSTLGGRVLGRHLKEELGLPERSLRYVAGHGDTAFRWKTFVRALDAFHGSHPESQSAIVNAAVFAFRRLRTWMTRLR